MYELTSLERLCIVLEPAFRSESLGVVAKDVLVALQDPAIHGDASSTWERLAPDVRTFWWHKSADVESADVETDRRSHTYGFFQTRLQV